MSSAVDPGHLRRVGLGRAPRVHQALPRGQEHPVPRAELSPRTSSSQAACMPEVNRIEMSMFMLIVVWGW